MGAINFSIGDFYDSTSEIIGIKSGLLLDDNTIKQLLKEKFDDDEILDETDRNIFIRVRSEVYEDMIRYIRIRIGNKPKNPKFNYNEIFKKYIQSPSDYLSYSKYLSFLPELVSPEININFEYLVSIFSQENNLSPELVNAFAAYTIERIDDSILISSSQKLLDITPLEDLFKCEVFTKTKNTFIDQKFIDYLAVNGNEIELIHWRNFEKFCAEYFKKKGFVVKLGPGKYDGGIDIRVFSEINKKDPYIVIQCKRHKSKNKIAIETVKAFHSDVVFENAKLGLIATSSQISKGGKKVVLARDYRITFAEKENVKSWAKNMWTYK
jgi:restriction system protein